MTRAESTERPLLVRLNRRLADEGRVISISRTGKPARYVLRDCHRGNPEGWAEALGWWAGELGVTS